MDWRSLHLGAIFDFLKQNINSSPNMLYYDVFSVNLHSRHSLIRMWYLFYCKMCRFFFWWSGIAVYGAKGCEKEQAVQVTDNPRGFADVVLSMRIKKNPFNF